ncbi:c-type cytochrome [Mucilaginibacter sp. Bleaf8]|uniref:cbb3-type cytochrome c oxidase N-terminal domain-containing protein n=1 Tax=Mucilaginibacter sp. Bleaf8 TaxID=2834430 RepID=UPI001BCC32DE|nr:cbb3-type cytochrome c oxidase N-terminal domain-containing protein [Mucilaginibacter sp. Bleaf8]MBS7563327.1 c-type cytochrome [Mucilaginibacter sp. Bleaf8]
MNLKKITLLCLAVAMLQPALAADDSLIPDDIKNYIGYGAIMVMLLLLIVAMLVLLKAFRVLTKALLTPEQYAELQAEEKAAKVKKPKAEVINKLLSLKPLSEEKSILIEHEYDGIQELDNPTPAWFMGLFYVSIVFAVAYFLGYHVFGIGQLQDQEYVTEMKIAAKEKEAYLAKAANRVDESTVTLSTDPAALASGQAVFKASCMPCHGDKAQGVVGPNLTDDFWLHGGKINDVFKTIKYGVTAKGMPTWEKQLTPKQIADVSSYIKSLHGTNPPGAKEPQGEKEVDDAAASAAAKTAMVVKP